MSRYLPESTKTGDFNPQKTLSGSFFVILERLASVRAVVLAFTANKQTNTLKYIYIRVEAARLRRASTAKASLKKKNEIRTMPFL